MIVTSDKKQPFYWNVNQFAFQSFNHNCFYSPSLELRENQLKILSTYECVDITIKLNQFNWYKSWV